jgi:hypothetical protein
VATLIRNRSATPITLPYPYSGALPGGGSVVLEGTPAVVLARMGLNADKVFELTEVSDHDLVISPVNGSYAPPAGAKLYSFPAIAAKSATVVAAALAANSGKATKSLAIGGSALDTVVQAHTAGAAGNSITVRAVGDSAPAGGVTISRAGTAFTIHFEDGVSTVADVEAAIAALAGADDLFDILTAGTGATVLSVPGDEFIATALAGGSDTGNAFTVVSPASSRNLRVTMAAGWDGGDVTVVGTDQSGAAQSEVFATGSGVVRVGAKVFATTHSASKASAGLTLNTASIGTGDKLGAGFDPTGSLLFAGGVSEAMTADATNMAFTPTTVPNGAVAYTLMKNVVQAP